MMRTMRKSSTSNEYKVITSALRQMRKEAGLTQRQLAEKLNRPQSMIWRMETGERRIDLLEFLWICDVLGFDAPIAYARLCQQIRKMSVIYPASETPSTLKRVAEPKQGK
jgi:transcriptional regulator with XRE-family HTH domain